MKKSKKTVLLSGIGAIAATLPLAVVISCGSSDAADWKTSKTIVVSVDGAQEDMWNTAIKLFEKTDSYKKGFRIKKVNKDVFGAIDMVNQVGYTDENVGDLLYMPQDKFTSMLQAKALRPFTEKEITDLFEATGATTSEKKTARAYSEQTFQNKKVMFAFPHNREGIGVASKQESAAATKYLAEKGMFGAMNEAKAMWRLQDLWYGSALFGTPLTKNTNQLIATDRILYGQGTNWHSGFVKNDGDHNDFKKITNTIADMWYEPLAKAYQSETGATDDMIGTAWTNSQLDSAKLKNFFQADMGAVHNMLSESVSSGKLDYMYAGTWDAQNLAARGIKTYVNAPKDIDGSAGSVNLTFQQASGVWSYGINARNNGASADRIQAINEVIKAVYNKDSFTQYFLHDTKVPFFDNLQKQVATEAGKTNVTKRKAATDLYKNTEFMTEANKKVETKDQIKSGVQDEAEQIRELAKWFAAYNKSYDGLKNWSTGSEWRGSNDTPTAETNVKKPMNKPEEIGDLTYTDTPYKDDSFKYGDTLGVVGATAKLLGIDSINALDATGTFSYKVGVNKLKDGITGYPEFKDIKEGGDTEVHIRKLAKLWTSFNRDNGDETTTFKNQFAIDASKITDLATFKSEAAKAKTAFDAVVNKQVTKAKAFIPRYAKTNPNLTDAKIKEIVSQYLNNMWNETLRDAAFDFVQKYSLSNIKFPFGADAATAKTYSEVKTSIEEGAKTLALSEIFSMLTASSSDDKDKGPFGTQDGRFDRINPQFVKVWSLWNEQTWGNKVWLKEAIEAAINKAKADKSGRNPHDIAQEEFQKQAENHLDEQFQGAIDLLVAGNSQGSVDIE